MSDDGDLSGGDALNSTITDLQIRTANNASDADIALDKKEREQIIAFKWVIFWLFCAFGFGTLLIFSCLLLGALGHLYNIVFNSNSQQLKSFVESLKDIGDWKLYLLPGMLLLTATTIF